MVESITAVESEVRGGLAKVVLQSVPPTKSNPLYRFVKNVPSYASIASEYKPKTPAGKAALEELAALSETPYAVFVPAGTPAPIVLALTDAMRSALAQSSAKAEEDAQGFPNGFVTPQQTHSLIVQDAKRAQILGRFLN